MSERSDGQSEGGRTAEQSAPAGLREVLETSRLSLRALFRALDRAQLAQNLPPPLQALFELDADLVEALWVLDQPIGRFDVAAMTRDTIDSLSMIPDFLAAFFEVLSAAEKARLEASVEIVRSALTVDDAYLQVPGRDPAAD